VDKDPDSPAQEEMSEFPTEGMELTHILVVRDMDESVAWYRDVLGARLYREYGGNSTVFEFNGTWLLLVTAGEPTADKPGVRFIPPESHDEVGHSFTIRVEDCREAFETLSSRGAEFLTPPYDWGAEIRCFFRDPSGHLFEISEIPGD
jgi:catechol 2,3-dioxygenase-like lactoylglutathione lyase family enzyme